jgi:diguanylate cyclase (GGDEF)-like protein
MAPRPPLSVLFGSLRVRIAIVTLALVAVTAVAGTQLTRDRLRGARQAAARAEADVLARDLSADGAADWLHSPATLASQLGRAHDIASDLHDVSVSADGKVLAAVGDGDPSDPPALSSARSKALGGYGDHARHVRSAPRAPGHAARDLLAIERPLRDRDGRVVATVRFVFDWGDSAAALSRDGRRIALTAAGLALLAGLILILVLWRYVLAPLGKLRSAIADIRAGSIGTRLGWRRGDELGVLARDFDAMASELHDTQASLESLALRDPLTGLLNHRSFHEALQRAVDRARDHGEKVALVLLDLDHFKLVNDTHGHPYGDEALRAAGRELAGVVRTGADLVARVGGEEFALVLPGADGDAAFAAAERARASVARVSVPGGRALSSSAGVASLPNEADDAGELLRMADAALYEAKRLGRGRTCRYDSARTAALAIEDQRAEIEALLHDPEALEMVVQPWVELATGRIAGYEALARFQAAPTRTPDAWFAQAQRCGHGAQLEALAVKRALALGPAPEGRFVSVNVSPSAFVSPAVQDVLPHDLGRLVIEITEHEEIADPGAFWKAGQVLRRRGARIALDDAGAGYAGLAQLMQMRADVIKLDRGLIAELPDDPGSLALVEALVGFARRTGASVCAEGVETIEQLAALRDLDVTYAQGYALAKPASPWPGLTELATEALGQPRGPQATLDAVSSAHDLGDRRLEAACALLSRCSSPEELRIALELAADELGADEASVIVCDDGHVETLCSTPGWPRHVAGELHERPAIETAVRDKQAVQVHAADPSTEEAERRLLGAAGFQTKLVVPALNGGESVGAIALARRSERPFTSSQINRAQVLAYQVGALLHSGRALAGQPRQTVRYRGSDRLARI